MIYVVHLYGPDDLFFFKHKERALAVANSLNRRAVKDRKEDGSLLAIAVVYLVNDEDVPGEACIDEFNAPYYMEHKKSLYE